MKFKMVHPQFMHVLMHAYTADQKFSEFPSR
jgi:hypothetical protein